MATRSRDDRSRLRRCIRAAPALGALAAAPDVLILVSKLAGWMDAALKFLVAIVLQPHAMNQAKLSSFQ
jgi:hypothetical protein